MANPQKISVKVASRNADESRTHFMAAIKHRIVGMILPLSVRADLW